MRTPRTPAELLAALSGDIDNYVIATEDNGIEKQEARGQENFMRSETLPKKLMRSYLSESDLYKGLGITILGSNDDLFNNVKLPPGWTKKADNSLWSALYDDKGRKRASMFYKAAFYDRDAHISFNKRYTTGHERPGDPDAKYVQNQRYFATIQKDGKEIWRSEELMGYGEIHEFAKAKLLEIYPDAESEIAYWDEE